MISIVSAENVHNINTQTGRLQYTEEYPLMQASGEAGGICPSKYDLEVTI